MGSSSLRSWDCLPAETVIDIGQRCDRLTLGRLASLTKQTNRVLTPLLYRDVTIRIDEEDTRVFANALGALARPEIASNIERFTLYVVPKYESLKRIQEAGYVVDEDDDWEFIKELCGAFERLLDGMQSLKHFGFHCQLLRLTEDLHIKVLSIPTLESIDLNIGVVEITDDRYEELGHKYANIKEAYLNECDPRDYSNAAQFRQACPDLTSVCLEASTWDRDWWTDADEDECEELWVKLFPDTREGAYKPVTSLELINFPVPSPYEDHPDSAEEHTYFHEFAHLKRLVSRGCYVMQDTSAGDNSFFNTFVRQFPNLEELHISDFNPEGGVCTKYEFLAHMPELNKLSIVESHMEELLEHLGGSKLEYLSLGNAAYCPGMRMGYESSELFLQSHAQQLTAKCPNLVELSLLANASEEEWPAIIPVFAQNLPRLKALRIGWVDDYSGTWPQCQSPQIYDEDELPDVDINSENVEMNIWKKLCEREAAERKKQFAVEYEPGALTAELEGSSARHPAMEYIPLKPQNIRYVEAELPAIIDQLFNKVLDSFIEAGNYGLEYVCINKYVARVKLSSEGRHVYWKGRLGDLMPPRADPMGPVLDAWMFSTWHRAHGARPAPQYAKGD